MATIDGGMKRVPATTPENPAIAALRRHPVLGPALAAMGAGDAGRCLALCRSLIEREPGEWRASHLAGLALARLGRPAEAIATLERASAVAPDDADLLADLGRVHASAGHFDRAVACFERALAIAPARLDMCDDLATVYAILERFEDAKAAWERLLARVPDHAAAEIKLARMLALTGDSEAALAHADKAARTGGTMAARAAGVRGIALLAGARYREAAESFAQAIEAGDRGEALVGRARARLRLGDFDGARQDADAALAARPQDEDAGMTLYRAAREAGDLPGAGAALGRLAAARPQSRRARWARLNLIAAVPPDEAAIEEARAAWFRGIDKFAADLRLDSPSRVAEAFTAIQEANNFHLHYQRDDNLDAQKRYGALLHRIAVARFPALAAAPRRPPARARPRIGFISAFLRQHSIWKTHSAWITGTAGIEKYVYYAGAAIEEGYTTAVRDAADAFFHATDIRKLAGLIAGHALDALVWLDHGMATELQALAALWLAPVQANGLGHPVTSGLPTMTHALTSALMEPPDGAAQWTETPVRLDGTASCYSLDRIARRLDRLPVPERDAGRIDYLCAQNLAKYRPRDDGLFAAIAAQLPAARFNFLGDKPSEIGAMRERLVRAFRAEGLDAGLHCVFHGPLMPDAYLQLNRRCHVFLDSLGWSGNNTAHEAIACGLPVVTCPGATMRARHAAALLTQMGLTETIAPDAVQFVALAVRLGEDAAWRRHLGAETLARRDRLFDDPAPLRSLERFLGGHATG